MVDGVTLNPGTTYSLAETDWLLDHSEYSSLDLLADTGGATQEEDHNTPHGKKILIFYGGAMSGNSYSLWLIHYLAAELKTFRVVPIDLEHLATVQPGKQIFPFTLGQSIADRLRRLAQTPRPVLHSSV